MTEEQRKRFRTLRLRHLQGELLTGEEESELATRMAEIEEQEALALRASAEQQEQRIADLEKHATELRELLSRRQALVDYLNQVRQEVSREQADIDAAFERLINQANFTQDLPR